MTIIFNGDIPSGNFGLYTQLETGNAQGLTVVDDPLNPGRNVLRALMELGDAPASGAGGWRSELSIGQQEETSIVGTTRWYRWGSYIPEWQSGGNNAIIFQIHDRPDGGDPDRVPPIYWRMDAQGRMSLLVSGPVSAGDDNDVTVTVIDAADAGIGQWNDWVFRVVYEWDGTGAFDAWLNRRKVISLSNVATCYQDVESNYAKCGVYVPAGLSGDVPSRTVYHRGITVADGASTTFDQFMAECGSTDTELEGFVTSGVSL